MCFTFDYLKNTVDFINKHNIQGLKIHSTYVVKNTIPNSKLIHKIFFVIFVFPKLVKDQKIKTRNITTIVIIISAIINLFSFAIF